MNTKELMIGDWVAFEGKPAQVRLLSDYDIKIDLFRKGEDQPCAELWEEDLNECKPLPLTTEILEKNGFKKDKSTTHCERYFYAEHLDRTPQTVVEFSFYGDGVSADTLLDCWTKPASCDGENRVHICDVKYLHELQHALKLAGIDKTIEL